MSIKFKIINIYHNKFIRFIFLPLYNLYQFFLLQIYKKSKDSLQIKQLHCQYNNKRCFIIGNGPSLIPEDLNKIKGEISFASNRIYHIFPFTEWRPNYYISIDLDNIVPEIDNIKKSGDYIKFINYRARNYGRKESDNLLYIFIYGKSTVNRFDIKETSLNDDVSKYVTRVKTVTATAIEIAIYMGFKEIYLLGVDNNYAKKVDKNGKVYDDPTVKSSYFKGMKDSNGKLGDGISVQSVEAMNYSYKICKEFAEKKGVKIYNATRGGKLEVFERVDFDSLF